MMSNQNKSFKRVFAKCKRGSDAVTRGQFCPSTDAYLLSPERAPTALFRCVRCSHTWSVPLGGSFNL